MNKKQLPEINAGSMADIAFLLLIFFLISTTIEQDKGILRKLPKKQETHIIADIKAKNILEISINKNNEIMVDGQSENLENITQLTIDFLDNGGGKDMNGKTCDWCEGKKDLKSSDHPSKAVVLIETNRMTSYDAYISVLDRVNKAYNSLRNRLSKELYQVSYTDLIENEKSDLKNKALYRERINFIREKYPMLLNDFQVN